jgi:hypothetical protein
VLYLIRAPTRCTYPHFSKLDGTQSEPFSTRQDPNSTQRVIPSRTKHSTTLPRQEDRNKAYLPSTWGLLTRFGTMGTMSLGLNREEQGGPTKSRPTWPRGTGQETHNRGNLEDKYRKIL